MIIGNINLLQKFKMLQINNVLIIMNLFFHMIIQKHQLVVIVDLEKKMKMEKLIMIIWKPNIVFHQIKMKDVMKLHQYLKKNLLLGKVFKYVVKDHNLHIGNYFMNKIAVQFVKVYVIKLIHLFMNVEIMVYIHQKKIYHNLIIILHLVMVDKCVMKMVILFNHIHY